MKILNFFIMTRIRKILTAAAVIAAIPAIGFGVVARVSPIHRQDRG